MRISFYLGYMGGFTNDDYTSENISSCLRGSEIALIWITRYLQSKGNDVHVFSNMNHVCNDKVRYHQMADLQPFMNNNETDVLIIWRYVNFFIDFTIPKFFNGKIILWLHDYTLQPAWKGLYLTNDGFPLLSNCIHHVDKIVCVSENQASRIKRVKDSINVIGNGIVTNVFEDIDLKKKVPGRCIWTSAWNRGLSVLLQMWPEIQKRHPYATLHIYGSNDDTKEKAIEDQVSQMTLEYQVQVFGKSSNRTIAEAMKSADMFAYPCTFIETFCTSVLEAQMAGCLCVVTGIGALPETVGDRGLVVPFDNKFGHKFIMAINENLGMQPWTYDLREKAMKWASEQTWEKRGEAWLNLLES
jgi:glycosyltransferase involved in cell wall biosynthesis